MATTFSGGVLARMTISGVNTISTGINAPINVDIPGLSPTSLPNGTTAGTVGVGWADTRSYAAAATTLDLTALAAAATNTGAASFALITAILIINNDPLNSLTIGNAAATQFLFNGLSVATATFTIKPGGYVYLYDPSTAGMPCATAKNIKIDPGANTIIATVSLLGR